MKERVYLEEDLQLIRKYFPGARAMTLRTPFDLTVTSIDPWQIRTDDCDSPTDAPWSSDLVCES